MNRLETKFVTSIKYSLLVFTVVITIVGCGTNNDVYRKSHASNIGSQSKGQPLLVSIGGSITYGYNLGVNNDHPSQKAFPFLIGKKNHLQVDNLAVPGWTTEDLLNAIDRPSFTDSLQSATWVTLDIGGNDLLSALSVPLSEVNNDPQYVLTEVEKQKIVAAIEQIKINVPKILAKINQLTSAPIVIYTIYDPYLPGTPEHRLVEQILPQVNRILKNIATAKDMPLADAYSAFDGHQSQYVRVAENDIHPSVQGQIELAFIGDKAARAWIAEHSH